MKISLEEWIKRREEELKDLALDRQTLQLVELAVIAAEKNFEIDKEYIMREHEENVLQKALGIIFINFIGSIDGKKYLLERGHQLSIHGKPEENELYLSYETRIRTLHNENQRRIGRTLERDYDRLCLKIEAGETLSPEETERLKLAQGYLSSNH